jgi:hypothetical protein
MTHSIRFFLVTGFVLISLLAVGTVGAYNADPACASLMEVLNGTPRMSAIELVHTYTDGLSFGQFKLWTEHVLSPKEGMSRELRSLIESDGEDGKYLKWIILSTVSGNRRISYVLVPETNTFEKLPFPIDFPTVSPQIGTPANNPAQEIDRIVQDYLSRSGASAMLTQITRNRTENASSLIGTGTNASLIQYYSNRTSLRSALPVAGRFNRTLPSRPSVNISRP